MKKKFILLVLILLIAMPIFSADMVILNQPKKIYNVGSVLTIPLKINALNEINDFLSASITCPGIQKEIHKEYISLELGQEKEIEVSAPITIIPKGMLKKKCRIKFNLSNKYLLSDEFLVSNKILINITNRRTKFAPGESFLIEGNAVKEDGSPVNGFLNLTLSPAQDNSSGITLKNTVSSGYFFVEYKLPLDTKAGIYTLALKVYEKNGLEEITNYGETFSSLSVKQVPTSVEIILPSQKIEPGTETQVKVILHDQTGEEINSTSLVTIRNSKGKVMTQKEIKTGEPLKFMVKQDEPPSQWIINAKSEGIYNSLKFDIAEKQELKIDLINKTLIVKNIGNVPYNKTISIKIGNEVKYIDAHLKVGESKKYELSAPNGKYKIVVGSEGKDKFIKNNVALTGNAINVKEKSLSLGEIIKHPFVLGLIIFILLLVLGITIKKNYKKSFFKLEKKPKRALVKKKTYGKDSLNDKTSSLRIINEGSLAELSLTIKGEKQSAVIVCLNLKNFEEVKKNLSAIRETVKKITVIAEKNKSYVYEGKNSIYFIFIPSITKTFKNEKTAINLSESLKKVLDYHNRLFKQKISYGIGIKRGELIIKISSKDSIEFMPFENILNDLKKIASLSDKEVFLDKNIRDRLGSNVKTEKILINGDEVHIIKEIVDRESHAKFIGSFLRRMEQEEKKQEKEKIKGNKKRSDSGED